MHKSYILQAFVETPWAILPGKLFALEDIVARHVAGEKLSVEEIQARIHGAERPQEQQVSGVAVLPLFGTIFPRANMMTDVSGATSAERFGSQFEALMQDPNVSAIVLDVDSPGGQIGGVEELSRSIHAARGRKPVVAVANHLMASAAYWIATAADELVVSPSGKVGSVGVFAAHQDISKANENDGVKMTLISAGKYKVEGNPYEPLTDEARASIQQSVDDAYKMFIGALARNRGVSEDDVRENFGQGRLLNARQAVAMGMADRVATLSETINRLLARPGAPANGGRATSQINVPPSKATSSSPDAADNEREAQTLRVRVKSILEKEIPSHA